MQQRLSQNVLFSAIHLAMLFSTLFLLITFPFVLIPGVILYVKNDRKDFAIYYGVSTILFLILSAMIGGLISALSLCLFIFLPTVVMGRLYQRKSHALKVLVGGFVTLLGILLISLLMATVLGFNLNQEIERYVEEAFQIYNLQSITALDANIQSMTIETVVQMIPFYIIAFATVLSALTHVIARRVLNRMGEQISGLKPVKQWMVPRSLVWYYMLTLIANLFIGGDSDPTLSMIVMNSWILLSIILSVQGIGFLFFLADAKGWGRTLPIAGMVTLLVIWPLMPVFSMLGVFDVLLPLRGQSRTPKQ